MAHGSGQIEMVLRDKGLFELVIRSDKCLVDLPKHENSLSQNTQNALKDFLIERERESVFDR
jgi:hypothetical protein